MKNRSKAKRRTKLDLHPRALVQRAGAIMLAMALICTVWGSSARAACEQGCDGFNTFFGESALINQTTGVGETAVGYFALTATTTGGFNTATGAFALSQNTTGFENTAIGYSSLGNNTTGILNTAVGHSALTANSTGVSNTALGANALQGNTTGGTNTAIGVNALLENSTGTGNTATGFRALNQNGRGNGNTAMGANALFVNGDASFNTAMGQGALQANSGNNNTAMGLNALFTNVDGASNTATGVTALYHNTHASSNTADGNQALFNNTTGPSNTACGANALLNNTTGSNNIALGASAGTNLTTGSNNIDIGALGAAGESNTIRIGKVGTHTAAYITGIRGTTVAGGVAVQIDSKGRLGTLTSSARFKEGIRPMAKASEALLALKPVTFRYKKELDALGTPQFGLVAEEVAKVDPDLVALDQDGQPYTVRYDAVSAMLLNEFLKEHSKVEAEAERTQKQETAIAGLTAALAEQGRDFAALVVKQEAQIKALTTSLQKVSEQLSISRPPTRMVTSE